MGIELMADVEAIHIEPLQVRPVDRNGHWPCPFCGQTRPTDGAYSARVRNRTGPEHERWVRVCGGCVATLPRAVAS